MRKILVTGSIAFDNLMEFPGFFKESIKNSESESVSFSFLVKNLKRQKGGTAPNISYSLALVGEHPDVFGCVGCDFNDYRIWLGKNNVGTELIKTIDNEYTACCFVTTDNKMDQITSFYPGAMNFDVELSLKDINYNEYALAIIAPTMPEAMNKFVLDCISLKIPYMYDPGMQIPRIDAKELKEGVINSKISIFNDCEYDMMIRKTGLNKIDILDNVDLLVVTRGAEGLSLYRGAEEVHVPAARANNIVDPTGAGDAARAGIVKGYLDGVPLLKIGQYASITAVYAVEQKGATNHNYTYEDIKQRFTNNFGGEMLW